MLKRREMAVRPPPSRFDSGSERRGKRKREKGSVSGEFFSLSSGPGPAFAGEGFDNSPPKYFTLKGQL